MNAEERLDGIESKLEEQSKYNAEIRDTLNILLKGLESLHTGQTVPTTPTIPTNPPNPTIPTVPTP